MQIEFTPHKIQAAKAYIERLVEDEKKEVNRRKTPLSFFQRLKRFFIFGVIYEKR